MNGLRYVERETGRFLSFLLFNLTQAWLCREEMKMPRDTTALIIFQQSLLWFERIGSISFGRRHNMSNCSTLKRTSTKNGIWKTAPSRQHKRHCSLWGNDTSLWRNGRNQGNLYSRVHAFATSLSVKTLYPILHFSNTKQGNDVLVASPTHASTTYSSCQNGGGHDGVRLWAKWRELLRKTELCREVDWAQTEEYVSGRTVDNDVTIL